MCVKKHSVVHNSW